EQRVRRRRYAAFVTEAAQHRSHPRRLAAAQVSTQADHERPHAGGTERARKGGRELRELGFGVECGRQLGFAHARKCGNKSPATMPRSPPCAAVSPANACSRTPT